MLEEKNPLPNETLAAVASGDDSDADNCSKPTCPRCGSTNVVNDPEGIDYECLDCHYKWH